MRCETCKGSGYLGSYAVSIPPSPCHACGGSGQAHCCEGECSQPEKESPLDELVRLNEEMGLYEKVDGSREAGRDNRSSVTEVRSLDFP